MRGLDKDCDSTIDIQEFASRFAPVFTRLNMKQDVSALRTKCGEACSRICCMGGGMYMASVYRCNICFGCETTVCLSGL